MTDKTLPTDLHLQALRAIQAIDAWNSAIIRARTREVTTGKAGFYEHAIRVDKKHYLMRLHARYGDDTLNDVEAQMRQQGWTPQDVYLALGTARPAQLTHGPHVFDWFDGGR